MLETSKLSFHTVCFSTNFSNFSSVSIMRQYFMTAQCFDINYAKEYHIKFKHKIEFEKLGQIEIANSFYEISSFTKTNQACEKADCFIIFYDLENNESIRELTKILKYINETCDKEKKIYLLAIYTNYENMNNFSENNVKPYFSHNSLNNYSINTVNMDSSDELVETIDSLTEETLKEKMNANKMMDYDNSHSKCIII